MLSIPAGMRRGRRTTGVKSQLCVRAVDPQLLCKAPWAHASRLVPVDPRRPMERYSQRRGWVQKGAARRRQGPMD